MYLIREMDIEGRSEDIKVLDEERDAKGIAEGKSRKKGMEVRKKIDEGRGSELARECREEMKKRFKEGRVISEWEKGKKRFCEEKGITIEELKRKRKKGKASYEELKKKDKEKTKKEKMGKDK